VSIIFPTNFTTKKKRGKKEGGGGRRFSVWADYISPQRLGGILHVAFHLGCSSRFSEVFRGKKKRRGGGRRPLSLLPSPSFTPPSLLEYDPRRALDNGGKGRKEGKEKREEEHAYKVSILRFSIKPFRLKQRGKGRERRGGEGKGEGPNG